MRSNGMENDVPPYSIVLVSLLREAIYAEDGRHWETLLSYETPVREYFWKIHLDVYLDKVEGFAYLKSRALENIPEDMQSVACGVEGAQASESMPRLVIRRQLTYDVTLLCVLLREALMDFDYSESNSQRLVLPRNTIREMLKTFHGDRANEVKLTNKFDATINKVEELGFIRKLSGDEERFEVKRLLKAKIPAEALREIKEKLAKYAELSI
jgi:Domain of unknown function (DUF4194)